ncbi:charged multivesicular body protein 4 [Paragonimus westermani]|uniref:Charged multivesicular body protein 4 n=1 Tax=Paragonimus westermani TaxID=34504 RepID=A0A5J4NBQ3_9TREM|nr:charged multivesicular body protein 4 [Paragonimus westermani]
MSSFKKFFGSKKPEGSETRAAVKQLEDTRDLLTKKSEFLEKKIAEEIALAKKYGMKNKKMALKALARKKGYENQLQKIDNTMLIIENQIQSIDNAGMNLEVFKVLKNTAGTLKTAHKHLYVIPLCFIVFSNVDDVHDIMDEIAEQRDIANEISDAISNTSAFGLDVDEDELLAELEGLQAEDLENQLLDVGSVSDLPNVPTKELPGPSKPKAEDTSDKDLNELLAWAE